jgi:hypothetical protein
MLAAVAACVRAERMTSTAFPCLFTPAMTTAAVQRCLVAGVYAPGVWPVARA